MHDPYDLQRFVDAQQAVFDRAVSELRAGKKRSHWMWFVFPQLEGLGHSEMASRYGISGFDEAVAYLQHPVLGPRLEECAQIIRLFDDHSAQQIFGAPDDIKLRSCMTLFAMAAPENPVFQEVLELFFDGVPDPVTRARFNATPAT